jgi:tyrosine-protein kinase Etk/Wzc
MANPPGTPGTREFDLAILLRRLGRNAGRVVAFAVLAGALAFAAGFLLPRWYRATAVILPPDESDLLGNLGMASRALGKFPTLGSIGEYFTPADIYKATLKSRMAQEYVAKRFDLQSVYRLRSRERTLKVLSLRTSVRLSPDGTISVSVDDRDPTRAAGMAEAYLQALDEFNIQKRTSQARRTREFLERRLLETDSLLRVSETRLRDYQQAHHVVAPAPNGGTDAASPAAADVLARKMLLEVRLGVLRSYLREDAEQVVQTRTELEQLKSRIAALPVLREDLGRLTRDAMVQEQLYVLLTTELEQARIQELRDTPTVQVLDAPVPPERPARPRKLVLAAVASLLAFACCVAILAFREELPTPLGR